MQKTIACLISLAAAVTIAATAWAGRIEPRDGTLTYTMLRDGDPFGTFTCRFKNENGRLVVELRERSAVKFAVFTLRRHEYDATEVWQGDRIVAMRAHTRDDSVFHLVELQAHESGMTLEVDGRARDLKSDVLPASLWNRRNLEARTLIDPRDGTAMHVTATLIGEEVVELPAAKVPASHYRLTAEGSGNPWSREVWYDANDRLVKVRYTDAGASMIEYHLR
ncbi:MAG: hypothetical protein FJX35_21650 [Alphaproteobacteria bacterium]|nr:hypothetical protein [Alphaproteobacteria bacterium]